MDSILKIETLNLFLFFVVPGFVALSAHDLIVPAPRRNFSEALIQVISFSMINLLFWFWLIDWMGRVSLRVTHPVIYYVAVAVVIGLSPAILAALTIRLRKAEFLRGKLLHPAPTGWDFFFGQRKPCFVLCYMKSGARFGGYFGKESYASAYPSPQEVYLQRVWKIDEHGNFDGPVEDTSGAIIRTEECEIIELFEAEG